VRFEGLLRNTVCLLCSRWLCWKSKRRGLFSEGHGDANEGYRHRILITPSLIPDSSFMFSFSKCDKSRMLFSIQLLDREVANVEFFPSSTEELALSFHFIQSPFVGSQ
jgi:hypothetical protein